MTTTAFEAARAELVLQSNSLGDEIEEDETALLVKQHEHELLAAEIKGMDLARNLLAVPEIAIGSERTQRPDVQGAVMALFPAGPNACQWQEADIIDRTDLSQGSVHAFLLRAVRTGMLARDGELYRLPPATEEEPPASEEGDENVVQLAAN